MPTDGLKMGGLPTAKPLASPQTPPSAAVSDVLRDDERERLVESLRRAVASGAYRVEGIVIADRLLDRRALEGDED